MKRTLLTLSIILLGLVAFSQPIKETSPSSITSLMQRLQVGKNLFVPTVSAAPTQRPSLSALGGQDIPGALLYNSADTSIYVYVSGDSWVKFPAFTYLSNLLNTKEPVVTAGTTSQYYRGDKTWQTLPTYTLSGLGGVPTARTISINGVSYDLSADRNWTINSMVYPGVGIPVSTGTGWGASIVDNSTNWNSAYTSRIISATSPLSIASNGISIAQANSTTAGYLSSADWNTFNNKQAALTNPLTGSGTANYLPKYTAGTTLGNSMIFDNGTSVGINTSTPNSLYTLDINGPTKVESTFYSNSMFTGSHLFRDQEYITASTDGYTRQNTYNEANAYTMAFVGDLRFGGSSTAKAVFAFNGAYSNTGGIYNGDVSLVKLMTGDAFGNPNPTAGINGYGLNIMPTLNYTQSTSNFTGIYYNPTLTATTGLTHYAMDLVSGAVKFRTLSGTGSRMVVADAAGVLSTQTIPSGTIASVSGTAPISASTTSGATTVSISQASTSANGFLSSTDWNIFNNKVGGSGTANQLAYFTAGKSLASSSKFIIDDATGLLTLLASSTDHTSINADGVVRTAGIALNTYVNFPPPENPDDEMVYGTGGGLAFINADERRVNFNFPSTPATTFDYTFSSTTGIIVVLTNALSDLLNFNATAPLVYSAGNISITRATTTANGFLASTDWNTFNNKQNRLSGTGFVKVSGTTVSYDNSTYVPTSRTITINGTTLDLSADRSWTISAGVPYTGATADLDLGTRRLYAASTQVEAMTIGSLNQGYIAFITGNSLALPAGTGIAPSGTTGMWFSFNSGAKRFSFDAAGLTDNVARTYTMPNFNGTLLASVGSTNRVLINTSTDDGSNFLQVNGSAVTTQYRLSALNTAPASSTATGTTGEIRITSDYIYVCIATNTWVRSTLSTF